MSTEDQVRETWSTRIGFIFAAVGSAVGLGNIWSFPFQTASNGGAAFVLVYLATVVLIGFPTMLVEFVIGRGSNKNPIDAFGNIGFEKWSFIGILGVLGSLITLAFYSVVGGWVISYIVGSGAELANTLGMGLSTGYFGNTGGYFASIASGPIAIATHAIFMGLTIGIVAFGINDGIERATKFMIPAILVLLVGLAAWVSTLSGAGAGYSYYLSPDFGKIVANFGSIVPDAVGQAFFTLSIGFSVMIAYSSHLGQDDSLPADGGAIVIVNTLVAMLAGFVIFPIIFVIGGEVPQQGGAGTAFTSLAGAFSQLTGGALIGFFFFVILLFAALSSSISLLEVPVGYLVDHYDFDRPRAAFGIGTGIFVLGIPAAMGPGILGWYNDFVFNLVLPVIVLLLVIFVGWVGHQQAFEELNLGSSLGDTFTTVWMWWIRIVIPVAISLTLVLGIQSLLLKAGILQTAILL